MLASTFLHRPTPKFASAMLTLGIRKRMPQPGNDVPRHYWFRCPRCHQIVSNYLHGFDQYFPCSFCEFYRRLNIPHTKRRKQGSTKGRVNSTSRASNSYLTIHEAYLTFLFRGIKTLRIDQDLLLFLSEVSLTNAKTSKPY